VHEALNLDSTSFSPTALPSSAPALSVGGAALDRLFGDAVWGRLPVAAGAEAEGGQIGGKGEREAETRLRRTALGVVGVCVSATDVVRPTLSLFPSHLSLPSPPSNAGCVRHWGSRGEAEARPM
jgi:hypothetical protein